MRHLCHGLKPARVAGVALFLFAAANADAQDSTRGGAPFVSAVVGTSGGTPATLTCPKGKLAVGVAGTRLKFITRVTLLCALAPRDSVIGYASPLEASAVGTGTEGYTLQCPAQQAMIGARVGYHTDEQRYRYLGAVEVTCARWQRGTWSGPAQVVADSRTAMAWPVHPVLACVAGIQAVVALRVRRSTAVHALGIVCDEPDLRG